MDIYQKVKSLKLPKDKYVVFAGSALEGYGIRKSKDIDIVVTKDVYQKLKNKEWKEVVEPSGHKVLKKGIFGIGNNFHYNGYRTSTENLIKTANIIKGVPFADLKEVIKFKKVANRDKDKKDVELINQHLKL